MVETITVQPRTDQKVRNRLCPPYHVVIFNDDHHTMEFVVMVLTRVFGYTLERSVQLMLEAHHSGRAVVWTGAKEVAELKVDQIRTYHEKRDGRDLGPLNCSIEPAEG